MPAPKFLTCPIGKNVIVDPVTASDGHTYDRKNIEKHIRENTGMPWRKLRSPVTGQPLASKLVRTNYLARKILAFYHDNPNLFNEVGGIEDLLDTELTDAITLDTLVNPKLTTQGQTYNHDSLKRWIAEGHDTDIRTGRRIDTNESALWDDHFAHECINHCVTTLKQLRIDQQQFSDSIKEGKLEEARELFNKRHALSLPEAELQSLGFTNPQIEVLVGASAAPESVKAPAWPTTALAKAHRQFLKHLPFESNRPRNGGLFDTALCLLIVDNHKLRDECRLEHAKKLVQWGADLESVFETELGEFNYTELAAIYGDAVLLEYFLKLKVAISDCLLHLVIEHCPNNIEILELVIQYYIKYSKSLDYYEDGMTPLLLAVHRGVANAVKILIKSGARVVEKTQVHRHGERNLMTLAIESDQPHVLSTLLQTFSPREFPVDHLYRTYTPLQFAASKGRYECVRILCHDSDDINGTDRNGRTALHIAISYGYIDIASLLIRERIDVNIRDRSNDSAIDLAASRGYDTLVAKLLAIGANVNEGTLQKAKSAWGRHHRLGRGFVDEKIQHAITSALSAHLPKQGGKSEANSHHHSQHAQASEAEALAPELPLRVANRGERLRSLVSKTAGLSAASEDFRYGRESAPDPVSSEEQVSQLEKNVTRLTKLLSQKKPSEIKPDDLKDLKTACESFEELSHRDTAVVQSLGAERRKRFNDSQQLVKRFLAVFALRDNLDKYFTGRIFFIIKDLIFPADKKRRNNLATNIMLAANRFVLTGDASYLRNLLTSILDANKPCTLFSTLRPTLKYTLQKSLSEIEAAQPTSSHQNSIS